MLAIITSQPLTRPMAHRRPAVPVQPVGVTYKPPPPLQPETSALLNWSLRIEENLQHLKCALEEVVL